MIKIAKRTQVVDYTPVDQRGEDVVNPASFRFKELPTRKKCEIRDRAINLDARGRVQGIRTSSLQLEAVLARLDGWSNIYSERDGAQVEIKFDASDKEGMFELLPEDLKLELMEQFGDLETLGITVSEE